MTPIGPVPFVGRQSELAELKQHLAVVPLVSLHGALGSGKTRLVSELAFPHRDGNGCPKGSGPPASFTTDRVYRLRPGTTTTAVVAYYERALH